MSTPTARAAAARVDDGRGRPPEQPTLWARLESPVSTYYLLVFVVGALLLFGLVMVLSASYVLSLSRTGGSPWTIFRAQAQFAAIGVVGLVVASHVPVALWRRLAWPAAGLATLLLGLVPLLGEAFQGNRNWLRVGGVTFQPSEFGKVALILVGAHVLAKKRRLLHVWSEVVSPFVLVAAGIVGLVLYGRDAGTALILLAIVFGLLWAAGVPARMLGLAAAASAVLGVSLMVTSSHRLGRVSAMLHCTDAMDDACRQIVNGRFAFANGGLFGQGLGHGALKWGWVPEGHNDFIFAVIGEELGLGGTLLVLVLFALLAVACYRIVMRTDDMFVRLATTGVMVWVLAQAIVNIGSVTGLLPVIGVNLPLISAGGSSLVTTLGALGMLISFARHEPACQRALAARPSLLNRLRLARRPGRGGRR